MMDAEYLISIAVTKKYLKEKKIVFDLNSKNNDKDWVYFPLFGTTEKKSEDNFSKLLSSESDEEQEKNYRAIVCKRLKEIGLL